jgi:hypothetical protein
MLKYDEFLHRYIKKKMEFLDIASLGTTYRYGVNIKHKFKQKRREFGFENSSQLK